MVKRPKECPKCKSAKVAEIAYGLPRLGEAMKADLAAGTKILGGCCLDSSSPQWQCMECKHRWGEVEWLKKLSR